MVFFVDLLRQFRLLKVISSVDQKNHSPHKGNKRVYSGSILSDWDIISSFVTALKFNSITLSLGNSPGGILNIDLFFLTTEVFKKQKVRGMLSYLGYLIVSGVEYHH